MFYYFKTYENICDFNREKGLFICKDKQSFEECKNVQVDGTLTKLLEEGTCDFDDKGIIYFKNSL